MAQAISKPQRGTTAAPRTQGKKGRGRLWLCSVKISALALLKMAMHAKSGGNLEIMGMLQGKVVGTTFLVLDAFALPVEGTETRVNAQAEAYEFMIDFAESNKVWTPRPSSFLVFADKQPSHTLLVRTSLWIKEKQQVSFWEAGEKAKPPLRSRWAGWKTWWVGTTATPGMAAGCPELMWAPR